MQDAYSERCAAQVHGACRDALAFIAQTVEVEANASTDNPMVFADAGDIVSGGNFHGAPIGLGADLLAAAVTHVATISERRAERLVNPALSDLPAFLTVQGGLESGLMLAQVTAAALASELKALAHPVSVDTIPTSANKEDHVSMSMAASLKAASAVQLGDAGRRGRVALRVRGARPAFAAHDLGAACRRCTRMSARASRAAPATVRRRPTSKQLPR